MKHLIKVFLTLLVIALAAGKFAEAGTDVNHAGPLEVRFQPTPWAPKGYTIKPNESFQVIKWNRYNTRIRLADGRIGWVDKDVLKEYAPANHTGYANPPALFTLKSDGTTAPQGGGGSTAMMTAASVGDTNEVVQSGGGDNAEPVGGGSTHQSTAADAGLAGIGAIAWKNATETRKYANFLHRRGSGTGNTSKGMCAAGLKETLIDSHLCTPAVQAGSAILMHTQGNLKRYCPGLKYTNGKNPLEALGGSVIVYNRPKHHYGHIEIKIPVTKELLALLKGRGMIGKNGQAFPIGSYMYCSDYCSARPIQTTGVAAIYSLK